MTVGSSVEVARIEVSGARRLDLSVLVGIMPGRRRTVRFLRARSMRVDFCVRIHWILMPLIFMPVFFMRAGFLMGSVCPLNRIEVGQPLVAHT